MERHAIETAIPYREKNIYQTTTATAKTTTTTAKTRVPSSANVSELVHAFQLIVV